MRVTWLPGFDKLMERVTGKEDGPYQCILRNPDCPGKLRGIGDLTGSSLFPVYSL